MTGAGALTGQTARPPAPICAFQGASTPSSPPRRIEQPNAWGQTPIPLPGPPAPNPPEDAERFLEEVRGDDPELASYLRIEERELEAGGRS
jgi:hypothetical protein